MTDCTNDTMRDRLPALANGMLPADESAAVRAHVAACPACAGELALIETSRLVIRAETPRLDLDAITRAVLAAAPSAAPAARPALKVERGGATPTVAKRPFWRSRQVLAAAASILVVVSLTIPTLTGDGGETTVGPSDTARVVASAETLATGAPSSGTTASTGLSDLSSDDLSALLAELDGFEANIGAEPASVQRPVVDTPEID